MLIADVSEPSISSMFIGRWMKMELIEGYETSAISIVTPGNYPKENILHTGHGESLKSRICILEGPEDDSVRIETCFPNTVINIIKFCCV